MSEPAGGGVSPQKVLRKVRPHLGASWPLETNLTASEVPGMVGEMRKQCCSEPGCRSPRLVVNYPNSKKKRQVLPVCRKHWGDKVRGRNSGRYADDRVIDKEGYVKVRVDGALMAEHRHVMEQILGRKLIKGESVHHKDGIRSNNSPENLELWVGGIRYGQRAKDICCPHCGKSYMFSL